MTMVVELLLLAVCLVYILIKLKTGRMERCTRNIYGEKCYPLIGNMYKVLKLRNVTDFCSMADSVKESTIDLGITKFWIGPILLILISDPKYIRVVSSSPFAVKKSKIYRMIIGDTLQGIALTQTGQKWRELRKPFVRSFTRKLFVSRYNFVFVRRSNALAQYIHQHKTGLEFNIFHLISNMFLDIFSETHLGVETNEVVQQRFDFVRYFHETLLSKIMIAMNYSFYFRRIGERFSQYGRPLQEAEKKMDGFLQWGAETSSVVSSSALVFLAMFPQVQEKAYQEQISIFGDAERDPTYEDLSSMVYLNMVIKETLRLIGVPAIARIASEDIILGEYTIPKGAQIAVWNNKVHSDPRYWEQPKQFHPDHFLPEQESMRPRFAYIPFGISPRTCPGFQYAMTTIAILLSTILRNFQVKTSLKYEELQYDYKIMLEIHGGYNVEFCNRNKC